MKMLVLTLFTVIHFYFCKFNHELYIYFIFFLPSALNNWDGRLKFLNFLYFQGDNDSDTS